MVIRSLNGEGSDDKRGMYKLKVFDTIKLGRVSFKIKGFNFKTPKNTFNLALIGEDSLSEQLTEAVEVKTADSLNAEGDSPTPVRCRICWGFEENKILDPLILACKCKGSVGFIHFLCLK